LLHASISQSTHATYAAALRRYREWCVAGQLDPSPLAMTTGQIVQWLSVVGSQRRLMADTLSTYRSAVSTAWALAGGTGSNPAQDALVSRVVQGYANVRQQADAQIRHERQETVALTAELLAQISVKAPGVSGGTPEDIMEWAAACFLTFGLNRCAEAFGSSRIDRPPLSGGAVRFFARSHDVIPRALCPEGTSWREHTPDHYSVSLGPTKADVLGHNPPQRIAAAVAVQALWRWVHIRRDLGGGEAGPLFQVPGQRALTRARLFRVIQVWHRAATGVTPKITGKAFRRGGNQSLVASGAPLPDLQHGGRWASKGMPACYSSSVANATRGLHVSRGLGDIFAAAAAGRQR
jgi:hypothetical protein